MFIIVGLGNPGREYAGTRHNAGYMALDILADRFGIEIKRHNFQAVFGEGFVAGQKVALVKPLTFMNESGRAVRDIMNWYKCQHDQLLLIYDDIDIPLGDIRIRAGGSAGTHNGMRSVIYQLQYDDFPRVRWASARPRASGDWWPMCWGCPRARSWKPCAMAGPGRRRCGADPKRPAFTGPGPV